MRPEAILLGVPLSRVALLVALGALAGCATQPGLQRSARQDGVYDPRLGVKSSPRLYAEGEEIPPGGGRYQVGKPYTVAGKTYYPSEKPYAAVGAASWYGSDFHGRLTANGEVFDRNSLSAAHPTMPLPSYARVTNLRNGHSIIVRVNDRGPYHGRRVMDVSQRVAQALDFHRDGTTTVKVEYLGRADLAGSDNARLLASLRTDGALAQLDGVEDNTMTAQLASTARMAFAAPPPREVEDDAVVAVEKAPRPAPAEVKRSNDEMTALVSEVEAEAKESAPASMAGSVVAAPLPPSRPLDLGVRSSGKERRLAGDGNRG
ncbi:MAG TPA: septal ring lytic transglycosylase RlpA family protein [Methylocystis sp.]|nr:septal ring lytic transglycosylase RlpA family protein [Methylocystis sp.]